MWNNLKERVTVAVMALLFFALIVVLSGCDAGLSVRGKAFYPKENNGDVWKSRQANPEKPLWSWGETGR